MVYIFLLEVQVNLDLKNVHKSHSLIFETFFNQDSYLEGSFKNYTEKTFDIYNHQC